MASKGGGFPNAPKPPNPLGQKNPAMSGKSGSNLGTMMTNRMQRPFSPQHMATAALMKGMRPPTQKAPTKITAPSGMPMGSGFSPMAPPQAMAGSNGAAVLPPAPGTPPTAALHQLVGAAVMQHIAKHMMAGAQPGMPGMSAPGMPGGQMQQRVAPRPGVMGMKHGAGTIGQMGRLYTPQIGQKAKPGGVSVGNNLPNS